MARTRKDLLNEAQGWATTSLSLEEAKLLLQVKLQVRAVSDHWHRLRNTPVGDEVETLCFDRVPTTLALYTSLPPDGRTEGASSNSIPCELFVSALEAYSSALARVRQAVLEEPTRQLLVESIFARSKYGEVPPSLQLEDEG